MSKTLVLFFLVVQFLYLDRAFSADNDLPPKYQKQVHQIAKSYDAGQTISFMNQAVQLLKQAKPDQLQSIDGLLKLSKHPPLADMIAEVRFKAMMADVNLPKMSWPEFRATLPWIMEQISLLKTGFESSEYFRQAVPPASFQDYEKKFWDLHVLRNQFRSMAKVIDKLNHAKTAFKLNIHREKKNGSSANPQLFIDLQKVSQEMILLRNKVDEREAELRVHRTDDAESLVNVAEKFETRLKAAFALADDRLFFEQFFCTCQK